MEDNTQKNNSNKNPIEQLENVLEEYMIKKAPFAIPQGIKEFIANVSPYLIIIFAIFSIPLILAALGISSLAMPLAIMGGFGHGLGWGYGITIPFITSIIVIVMELMAVPGLFKRTKASWKLVFYASIVSLFGGILSIHGIFSAIIGAIIGWYILFQLKELYKN